MILVPFVPNDGRRVARPAALSVSAARAVVEATASPAGTADKASAGTVATSAAPVALSSSLPAPHSVPTIVERIACLDGFIEKRSDGSRSYNGDQLRRAHLRLRRSGVRGFERMLKELRRMNPDEVSGGGDVREVRAGGTWTLR
ncbi:hypothetical protein [Kribbella sp. NPDC004536]|uniref:hypothetical protein n=1 Tax=Kribbella sp. NPDC004536 TaxID=3364106 RepID=UPI0036C4A54B